MCQMTAEKIFSEWLNKQDYWVKALYRQIHDNNPITEEIIENIIKAYDQEEFEDIPISIGAADCQGIRLLKLYDVKGVNKLVPGGEIEFGENLTVVYGENGTGKTGYARIIQQLGKCLGDVANVRPNVFDKDILPEAKLDYCSNGISQNTVEWKNNNQVKLNIKLFNNRCVYFSLTGERQIDFMPQVFKICEELSRATTKLNEAVNRRLLELYDFAVNPIIEGTEVYSKVKHIITTCRNKDLDELQEYVLGLNVEELIKNKSDLEGIRSKLSVSVLASERKNLESLAKIIEQVVNTVKFSDFLCKKLYIVYRVNDEKISALTSNYQFDELLNKLNVPDQLKEPFTQFIKSADKLYRLYTSDKNGLESMTKCILCGRDILENDSSTKDVLHSYAELLRSSNIDQTHELMNQNKEIDAIRTKLVRDLELFGKLPNVSTDSKLSDPISQLKLLLADFVNTQFESNVNYQLNRLQNYYEEISNSIENNKKLIDEIDKRRYDLNLEINELSAKIDIINNWDQEKKYLSSYVNLSKIARINNRSISKCLKDIQETVYKDGFVNLLQNTLTELQTPKEVKFSPSISNSKMAIKQGYNEISKDNQLCEILSEGEQTVVALAQFIAESKFNPEENVLFFDDPVNSLDLRRMQIIAKALVSLAKEKQVIIFTHNLVFLGFIKEAVEKEKALKSYKYYQTDFAFVNGREYVGKIVERDNPNIETFDRYYKEIQRIIIKADKEEVASHEIVHAYGCIRSAIELLICDKMFRGTVERYRPDISVMRFGKIKMEDVKEDQEDLTSLYEMVCRYIDGHSSAAAAKIEPNLKTLREDFSKLESIARKYKQ